MRVDLKKSFFHDLKKYAAPRLKAEVEQSILDVNKAMSMREIPRLKKLKGCKVRYRIKVGSYRIGVEIENDMVTFRRCLPRKDFYKFFP
jgi:mRNA interferase RelE/StbE